MFQAYLLSEIYFVKTFSTDTYLSTGFSSLLMPNAIPAPQHYQPSGILQHKGHTHCHFWEERNQGTGPLTLLLLPVSRTAGARDKAWGLERRSQHVFEIITPLRVLSLSQEGPSSLELLPSVRERGAGIVSAPLRTRGLVVSGASRPRPVGQTWLVTCLLTDCEHLQMNICNRFADRKS